MTNKIYKLDVLTTRLNSRICIYVGLILRIRVTRGRGLGGGSSSWIGSGKNERTRQHNGFFGRYGSKKYFFRVRERANEQMGDSADLPDPPEVRADKLQKCVSTRIDVGGSGWRTDLSLVVPPAGARMWIGGKLGGVLHVRGAAEDVALGVHELVAAAVEEALGHVGRGRSGREGEGHGLAARGSRRGRVGVVARVGVVVVRARVELGVLDEGGRLGHVGAPGAVVAHLLLLLLLGGLLLGALVLVLQAVLLLVLALEVLLRGRSVDGRGAVRVLLRERRGAQGFLERLHRLVKRAEALVLGLLQLLLARETARAADGGVPGVRGAAAAVAIVVGERAARSRALDLAPAAALAAAARKVDQGVEDAVLGGLCVDVDGVLAVGGVVAVLAPSRKGCGGGCGVGTGAGRWTVSLAGGLVVVVVVCLYRRVDELGRNVGICRGRCLVKILYRKGAAMQRILGVWREVTVRSDGLERIHGGHSDGLVRGIHVGDPVLLLRLLVLLLVVGTRERCGDALTAKEGHI